MRNRTERLEANLHPLVVCIFESKALTGNQVPRAVGAYSPQRAIQNSTQLDAIPPSTPLTRGFFILTIHQNNLDNKFNFPCPRAYRLPFRCTYSLNN